MVPRGWTNTRSRSQHSVNALAGKYSMKILIRRLRRKALSKAATPTPARIRYRNVNNIMCCYISKLHEFDTIWHTYWFFAAFSVLGIYHGITWAYTREEINSSEKWYVKTMMISATHKKYNGAENITTAMIKHSEASRLIYFYERLCRELASHPFPVINLWNIVIRSI